MCLSLHHTIVRSIVAIVGSGVRFVLDVHSFELVSIETDTDELSSWADNGEWTTVGTLHKYFHAYFLQIIYDALHFWSVRFTDLCVYFCFVHLFGGVSSDDKPVYPGLQIRTQTIAKNISIIMRAFCGFGHKIYE